MLIIVQYITMSSNESANAMRPQIQEIMEMMEPGFRLSTFFRMFHDAEPTEEEMQVIVDKLPKHEYGVLGFAIMFRLWPLALMIARTHYDNNWDGYEHKIGQAHEKDNIPCHELMTYFGFPKDLSNYECTDCALCKKLWLKNNKNNVKESQAMMKILSLD